jgi:hypothetical protein
MAIQRKVDHPWVKKRAVPPCGFLEQGPIRRCRFLAHHLIIAVLKVSLEVCFTRVSIYKELGLLLSTGAGGGRV